MLGPALVPGLNPEHLSDHIKAATADDDLRRQKFNLPYDEGHVLLNILLQLRVIAIPKSTPFIQVYISKRFCTVPPQCFKNRLKPICIYFPCRTIYALIEPEATAGFRTNGAVAAEIDLL